MYPAQVVLPQARAGADDRGGDPAIVRRGSVCRARRLRSRRRSREPADRRQPAGQLDLVRASACWRSAPASRCCPSATYSFALAKMPTEAAAATTALTLLLALLAVGGAGVRAAGHERRPEHADVVLRAHRRSRSSCSTKSSAPAAPAATPTSASAGRTRARRRTRCAASCAALIDQGKDHDEIIQALHREVRQRGNARRADRQGIQPPGVAGSVPAGRDRAPSPSASPP